MIARPASRRLSAHRRPGFTLVEVMVVAAILLILAGLATVAVVRSMTDAHESETKLKMQKVEQACKTYYTRNSTWPTSLEELITSQDGGPPQMEGGQFAITDAWGQPFGYTVVLDDFNSERVRLSTTTPNGKVIQWPER